MQNHKEIIRPLCIAGQVFPINIIQGPLAGISCAPFRALTWQYSKPAFSYSEMISCKTIIHQRKFSATRYLHKSPVEGPVGFQLSSSCPAELGEAVKIVTDFGADLIDLNCGCPVKKIRRKGAGSKLLTDSSNLFSLITAMKNNTSVPVSIKIRVDNHSEKFNQHIAEVVRDAGADFLIVHGRHWTEHYETPCRYDAIQFFVEELNIPVIGNGDIACVDTLKKMFATGCAGVMIARAGVGQPWLIQQMISEIKGEIFNCPDLSQVLEIFFQHVVELSLLLNSEKKALLQARNFAKYYVRDYIPYIKFCIAFENCVCLNDLKKLCDHFSGLSRC